jgi:hypothetical protein
MVLSLEDSIPKLSVFFTLFISRVVPAGKTDRFVPPMLEIFMVRPAFSS